MKRSIKLFISLILPLLVGVSASVFTRPQIEGWYRSLNKPAWNPPDWVFGPVWTILYVLMGIALFLVWKRSGNKSLKRKALALWFSQLFFNFFWSLLFFNLHFIGWAFIEILLLWLLILFTILAFRKMHKVAAWLMVPYLAWVSFAAVLNWAILMLNS